MSPYARHRLFALAAVVIVGVPAFLIGGTYWRNGVDGDDAVARFRAAGPAAAEPADGLPEPGVYRYQTTGGERVSFLDHHRAYTPVTHRVVTRHGCGIREEQIFLVQHIEYYDRCGGQLAGYGTDIAFWWTHGTQDFVCTGGSFDGADVKLGGDPATWECHDEDTTAMQTTENLGDEEVSVDGKVLKARHTRWTTVFDGATKGAAVVEDWFDIDTGLVLKETRNIGLRVGSPFIGDLSYIDVSEYALLSTTPDT